MKVVDIREPGVEDLVIDTFRHAIVVVQLPPVVVLIAAPTSLGVTLLNRAKGRLPDKNYGSAIGELSRFWSCADLLSLPDALRTPARVARLTGAFVRCAFADRGFQSPVMREGTHQGLLLDGPWRSLFTAVEASMADRAEPELWAGHRYTAPLITSCNESGHPDGSIVDRDIALAFARQRGIGLFLTCEDRWASSGSYPIFSFTRNGVTIERRGPGLEELVERLPPDVRPVDPEARMAM